MTDKIIPVVQTVKSHAHVNRLVSTVSMMYDRRDQLSDLTVNIGDQSFRCHKLLLAISSPYFRQILFPSHQSDDDDDDSSNSECDGHDRHRRTVDELRLDDVCQPETFENVLRYVYRGEFSVSARIVGDVLRAAGNLRMDELKDICVEFMMGTLMPSSCVVYWSLAEEIHHDELSLACRRLFASQFQRVTSASNNLQLINEDMLKTAIEFDQLTVKNEVDVCEFLLRWRDAVETPGLTMSRLFECIRWSAVPAEYVGKLLSAKQLAEDEEGRDFLTRVHAYKLTGSRQFEGLMTFHRPSTGVELTSLLIGIDDGRQVSPNCWLVSLQRRNLPPSVARMKPIPTEQMHREVAACTNGSSIYVTGLGNSCRATCRWDAVGEWVRCADMTVGRRAHCLTSVSDQKTIYALGGYSNKTEKVMSSVEMFQTSTNQWSKAGRLKYAVKSSTAVAHGSSIYMFGGIAQDRCKNDINLECIQVFCTATRQCTELTTSLPQNRLLRLVKAVMWDTSVILVGSRTCLIFDIERQTWHDRPDFAAGVSYFGLVLENQTLFIFGGGRSLTVSGGKREIVGIGSGDESKSDLTSWICTDEVRSIPVMDIVNNSPDAAWTLHTKLPAMCCVDATAVVSLPIIN